MMDKRPLVIYHGGCRDGFCASWVCRHAMMSNGMVPEFYEGFYGKSPPSVAGRDVVIVDFSYPPPVMEQIAAECASLLVLDHHKTAEEALRGFGDGNEKVTVVFDMNRSGAGLALDHYFPGQRDRPLWWLVNYVEDRDLWRQSLPEYTAVSAYIGTIPFGFYDWDCAAEQPLDKVVVAGQAVEAKVRQYIKEVCKNSHRTVFDGYDVPIVNAPQVDISELVGFMANGETFAIGWWFGNGVFNYSLRSKGDFDVSRIAKAHGGGGHKNAAGFQSPTIIHTWERV